jgi:hypothetical protein
MNSLLFLTGFTFLDGRNREFIQTVGVRGYNGHESRLPAPPSVGTGAGRQGHGHVYF